MTEHSYLNPARPAKLDLGRCLVVGAAGFLGRALVQALLERGSPVRGLDRVAAFGDEPRVQFVSGDIRDPALVRAACAGCDTVFHTAAVINLLGVCRPSLRREVFDINLGGTRNVVRACQAEKVRRLVYTSTDSVCFSPGPVVGGDESLPYARRCLDIYAESKLAAERLVLAAHDPQGLRTLAVRPAGLWGPGPGCYMLSRFVEELARGNLVVRIGDGRSLGDNTHVRNLIHAELLGAEQLASAPERSGGQAYFVTDEQPMNLMEWFRPLVEDLGFTMPRHSIPAGLMYRIAHLSEWLHWLGGPAPKLTRLEVHNLTTSFTFRTDRARRELGYRPLIQRQEGLRECVPYCRERLERIRRGGEGGEHEGR